MYIVQYSIHRLYVVPGEGFTYRAHYYTEIWYSTYCKIYIYVHYSMCFLGYVSKLILKDRIFWVRISTQEPDLGRKEEQEQT